MKVLAVIDVIDFPETCKQCRFKQGSLNPADELVWLCELNDEYIDLYKASEWCPLRPMPIKQDTKSVIGIDLVDGFKDGWNYGWNACLEEILNDR